MVTIIDSTRLSSVLCFRGLVELWVVGDFSGQEGRVSCLADDGVGKFTAALPLGDSGDSVVPIPINCVDLTVLEIPFHFLDIVRDLQLLLDGSSEPSASSRI